MHGKGMLAMLLCTIKNEYIAYCRTKKLYKIKWEKLPLVIENKILYTRQ